MQCGPGRRERVLAACNRANRRRPQAMTVLPPGASPSRTRGGRYIEAIAGHDVVLCHGRRVRQDVSGCGDRGGGAAAEKVRKLVS